MEWTHEEESAFKQIMGVGSLERLPAIRLYRRCKDDLTKALQIAKDYYGLSDAQKTAYEQSRAKRLAGLARARAAKRLKGSIQQRNPRVLPFGATQASNQPSEASAL